MQIDGINPVNQDIAGRAAIRDMEIFPRMRGLCGTRLVAGSEQGDRMMRRIIFIAAAVLLLAVIITLIARIDLQECDALRYPVDAVVVLAGCPDEDRQRLTKGVDLMEGGCGSYLILPLRDTGLSWETLHKLYGVGRGIPGEKVLIGRPGHVDSAVLKFCGGTFGEAALTMGLMQAKSLRSAVVVSSRYHIPRVRLAFQELNSRNHLAFSYQPVGEPETDKLLSSARALSKRLVEYGKFFTAFFVYPIGAKIIEGDLSPEE